MISFDKPPESVMIDCIEYEIDYDFRTFIAISDIMSDKDTADSEKLLKSLSLCYRGRIPRNVLEAMKQMLAFYRCGEEPKKIGGAKREKAIYSYKHDAGYIYAAFLQQYGIDLTTDRLHWWKFRALFDALSDETLISKIMGYRAMDTAEIKDKKLKKRYERIKRAYALPDTRTEEEKEADFAAAF